MGTKNVNDSQEGFVGEAFISNCFCAINVFQHVNVYKKLTIFPSMSCQCIFKNIFVL